MPKLCCYCFSPNIVQFQNGSNKVAIELRVVEFWSEIILILWFQIALVRFWNHSYDVRPNCTPLSSISIINWTSLSPVTIIIWNSTVNFFFSLLSFIFLLFSTVLLGVGKDPVHEPAPYFYGGGPCFVLYHLLGLTRMTLDFFAPWQCVLLCIVQACK